jgi:outer membrane protein assembly factor BamB
MYNPALANGVLYVGSLLGTLYAIDALTGQEVWRTNAVNEDRQSHRGT